MGHDTRIDDYIAGGSDFARPILIHLRALCHQALPGCEEAIKWGMPHFTLAGKNVAGMAAFKAHCTFVIHGEGRQGDAMGQFGKITKLEDLPDDSILIGRLQEAALRIAETGTATKRPATREPRAEIPMPDDFAAALAAVPAAAQVFAGFSASARRDYLEWITEARTQATREKRMAEATVWIAAGKRRNWKYEKR
ncbi:YdeI/OmpD-associated family protein [Novosphingobium sp. 9]|uniref:YdeI/OmpD-associated family protein n=1 Tax=Novosphingobium sp. 9 TaxID=2025349 RepID=UPI0021B65BC5|nr:YdeI/OmpD-associated family protein [Novosphingobium sp. 9]